MNTKFEEIVNVNSIGERENPISLNEILKKANDEHLTPSKQSRELVIALISKTTVCTRIMCLISG